MFDTTLRCVDEGERPFGALLPERDALLSFAVRDGRDTLSVEGRPPIVLPTAPYYYALAVGPERGTMERDFPRAPVMADDGAVALPTADRVLRLGHYDAATHTYTPHAVLTLAPSHATQRVFLPGREAHVLATLDRGSDRVDLMVFRATGTHSQHQQTAVGLPARVGDALWFQRDDMRVTCVGLDGKTILHRVIPEAHRGPGTVFTQQGAAWFLPWHGEVLLSLDDNTVIDRALPGDPFVRRHVAKLARTLTLAGRRANLTVRITAMTTTRGAHPTLLLNVTGDGGDEGTLAHCVMGAAVQWHRWFPLAGVQCKAPTGEWVIAARLADLDEVLRAMESLDAHGLSLRDTVRHWAHVLSHAQTQPFSDEAAAVFLRVLVDPTAVPGTQRARAEHARNTPWRDEEILRGLAALRAKEPSHEREVLVARLLVRHWRAKTLAIVDAMIRAHQGDARHAVTAATLAAVRA